MVIGGGATLWGPIVGAFAYVAVEVRTREWGGGESEGLVGVLFGWLNGSPATLILAIVLLVLMFVAPFGIVGAAQTARCQGRRDRSETRRHP